VTSVPTALGFRPHSGWAVAVVVRGPAAEPEVVARTRVDLRRPGMPRQPYHAVAEAGADRGVVEEVADAALAGARAAIDELAGAIDGPVAAVGIVGEARDLPPLERILRSHPLLHTAEGELYRRALDRAAADRGLAVTALPARRPLEAAAEALGADPEVLAARLVAAGRRLGPPWQADHKAATAAALVGLSRPG
jgi:hypothetical protein